MIITVDIISHLTVGDLELSESILESVPLRRIVD